MRAVLTNAPAPPRTVRSPERWVISGLTAQTIGAVGVAAYAWLKLRNEGIGGHLTAATIRLAWHAEVHTRAGLTVLAVGALVYAAGSILMARPYASRPAVLFVAVPVAALVGILVLGALALVVAILFAALASDFDIPWLGGGPGAGSGRTRKRRRIS